MSNITIVCTDIKHKKERKKSKTEMTASVQENKYKNIQEVKMNAF